MRKYLYLLSNLCGATLTISALGVFTSLVVSIGGKALINTGNSLEKVEPGIDLVLDASTVALPVFLVLAYSSSQVEKRLRSKLK